MLIQAVPNTAKLRSFALRPRHGIETLEARIAPAIVISTPTTAHYTDADGDFVLISVSSGTLSEDNFVTIEKGKGEQLQLIDLSMGGFAGADLTVSVIQRGDGDGIANIGYINST